MKSITVFFMIFSSSMLLYGQDYSLEFGEVNLNDFKFEYAHDKDAEAVVLYDIGETRFDRSDNGFELNFTRSTKIKILSNAAADEFSEIEIPVYREKYQSEKIEGIKAITYNFENDEVTETPLNRSEVYEEKINENWYIKKFALPNVKKGSVIEYQYTLISPFEFNLQDWEFQRSVPTIYSKYIAKMIPFYEYVFLLHGAKKFDEQKSYVDKGIDRQFGSVTFQDYIHEFVMKNIPAFKDVDFITSKNDYIIKLDFQLATVHNLNGANIEIMTTWPDLIDELEKHENFGDYIKKSEKQIEKNPDLLTVLGKGDLKKLEIGVNYVKANFNWDGIFGKYANKDIKEFVTEKTGNIACLNLYLVGVLRSLGVQAFPLILSTRPNGKIYQDYPFSSFFNYVLVAAVIDGNIVLTDASEVQLPYYRIPERCINDKGLLISKNEIKWIELTPKFLSKTRKEFQMSANEKLDSLEIQVTASFDEYDGLKARKNYFPEKEISDNLIDSKNLSVKRNITFENEVTAEKPFVFSFAANKNIEMYNEKIYISPFIDEVVKENPFKQNERAYSVDLIYPASKQFKSVISIPQGYKLQAVPKAFNHSDELAEVNYLAIDKGNQEVFVDAWFIIKKSIYPAEDYLKLKNIYNEIIKYFNQQIVLEKVE